MCSVWISERTVMISLNSANWLSVGAFPKLRKATISFAITVRLTVRPSVRLHGTSRLQLDGFSLNLIVGYFRKSVQKKSSCINVWQEQRVLYMNINAHFLIISRSFLLRMRNVSDKSCRENQNIHFVFSNFFFFFENCAAYEIMWKSMVHQDRPQMTIRRMRTACCIPKATHTHNMQYLLLCHYNDGYANAPQY
jgi:hypothetical protein